MAPPRALQLVFFALWITFFLPAAAEWTGLAGCTMPAAMAA